MRRLVTMAFLTLLAQISFAGGGYSVGNGGVLWACVSGLGDRDFHQGLLSDLFEARQQYQWTLVDDPGGDPIKFYEDRKVWLSKELPEMFAALKSRFEYVENHRIYVSAELLSTQDFNNAIKPLASTCPQGLWKPINIANFREEDQQVLISLELWNSPNIPTIDKAALLFHEAIYYWMRTYYGSTNSDKARKITGILFSTLDAAKKKSEIARVLGSYPDQPDGKFVCLMLHQRRNQLYVAYGMNLNQASLDVRMRCQADAEPQLCLRTSLECEEIIEHNPRQCVSENLSTRSIYVGKGRGLLEAQFNAHMACFIGSKSVGNAQEQNCPPLAFMECD